jgi:hypothetical protein
MIKIWLSAAEIFTTIHVCHKDYTQTPGLDISPGSWGMINIDATTIATAPEAALVLSTQTRMRCAGSHQQPPRTVIAASRSRAVARSIKQPGNTNDDLDGRRLTFSVMAF